MAALKLLNNQPTRLVLGKGGGNALATLIGIGVFGIVAFIGLTSILSEGNFNPAVLVIAFVIGIAFLGNFINLLSSTRVILDAGTGTASRTDSILIIPTRRQDMAVNLIRDVRVTQPRGNAAFVLDTFPIWRVELRATDGSTLLVNDRGTRGEMNALAQQVGTLLNRPVREPNEAQAQAQAQPQSSTQSIYTPTGVMTSLYENLVAFAQSAAESANQPGPSPTISAFPDTRPSVQDRAERASQRRRSRHFSPGQPEPNTFTTTTMPPAADSLVLDESPNFPAGQGTTETATAFTAPPLVYTAPPVLVMPNLPGMLSFAPALNMPSFPPIGGINVEPMAPVQQAEFKQVDIQVAPPPSAATANDASALVRQARQLYASRNLKDAQAAWFRALSANPADASVQNDLGVVYLEQNKLPEAERAFRRALALAPLSSVSRYNLGIALARSGKLKQANEQFQLGVASADRDYETSFREALRGNLRAPLLSQ